MCVAAARTALQSHHHLDHNNRGENDCNVDNVVGHHNNWADTSSDPKADVSSNCISNNTHANSTSNSTSDLHSHTPTNQHPHISTNFVTNSSSDIESDECDISTHICSDFESDGKPNVTADHDTNQSPSDSRANMVADSEPDDNYSDFVSDDPTADATDGSPDNWHADVGP